MLHDTLKSANILRKAGFAAQQAEAVVKVMTENLATKEDIENLSLATQRDMKELRRDMNSMETSIRSDMEKMGTKLENSFDSRMQKTEYSIHTDMKDMGTSICRDLKEFRLYTKGQFVLLKWMWGVIGAGVGAIVFQLFFQ